MKLRGFAAALLLLGMASVRADVALDWDGLMLDAIRIDNTSPNLSSRNLAILHVAIHDAVNSVEPRYEAYGFKLVAKEAASTQAAAAGAGHEVMTALYPSFAPRADRLLKEFQQAERADKATPNGIAFGRKIAQLALDSRKNDGIAAEVHYHPSELPGQWRRTPPYFRPPVAPHWGEVSLFCLPDKQTFLPPPPPALDSPEYAADLNEVKSLGAKKSKTRTAEQTQIAVFWSDFSYTAMPPGHWHEIAAGICRRKKLDLPETARLFALLSIAQADAAIVCWEAKYRHNFWRPVTAIQRAGEDGNPQTDADGKWDALLSAPPFPGYVSGHSMFSKASAEVLTHFFGTDKVEFEATSDSLPGVVRRFTSFAACADEVGMSRIYGGIHFGFDNTQGKLSGQKIGDYVSTHCLAPIPGARLQAAFRQSEHAFNGSAVVAP